jgi:hypothetical protein
MKRWYSNYAIRADFSLGDPSANLAFTHPVEVCEISICDSPEDDILGNLTFRLVFEAKDIESAAEKSAMLVEELVNYLSIVVNLPLTLGHHRFLIDWSKGISPREAYQYLPAYKNKVPKILGPQHLISVTKFQSAKSKFDISQILRWYAAGIRSSRLEDQFQFFWFVIESIAEQTKSSAPVTDKCQSCRGDLYCPKCEKVSSHKPFPKQAIENLLQQINLAPALVDGLFKVRNKLLHGTPMEDIESEMKNEDSSFEFHKAVDIIGKTANLAILRSFKFNKAEVTLDVVHPSTLVDWKTSARTLMKIGIQGDPMNPQFTDVVMPTTTWALVPG